MDGRPGGHPDREKAPRFLQRLGCHAVDAPARVQPAGARAASRRARRAGRHRVAGGDLVRGKRTGVACGGYICFEDGAGFTRRPPRGRTWGRRGRTPVVTVSGRCSGRLSVAGLIAIRPGSRTRLRTHPAGKGERRSMGERDFIALIDGAHQMRTVAWPPVRPHPAGPRRREHMTAARSVPGAAPRAPPRQDAPFHQHTRLPAAPTLNPGAGFPAYSFGSFAPSSAVRVWSGGDSLGGRAVAQGAGAVMHSNCRAGCLESKGTSRRPI